MQVQGHGQAAVGPALKRRGARQELGPGASGIGGFHTEATSADVNQRRLCLQGDINTAIYEANTGASALPLLTAEAHYGN